MARHVKHSNSEKKEHEKQILSHIYDLKNYTIEYSDPPDFIMQHKHLTHRWGVEITSVFFSESSARLKKIKNYALDLIDNEMYRHKDDKEHLKIQLASLVQDGKEGPMFKAIMTETPPLVNYLSTIADSVKRKNDKFEKYSSELNHINLVINDEENYFRSVESKDFQRLLFQNNLYDLITGSRFREVFIVTTIKENRKVYFPLKMMWFVSQWYKFNYMYAKYYQEREKRSANDYLSYFVKYLYDFGLRDAYILIRDRKPIFYYALVKITFEEGRVRIYEEPDLVIPQEAKNFTDSVADCSIDPAFLEHLRQQEKTFSYSLDFCLESKKEVAPGKQTGNKSTKEGIRQNGKAK